MTTSVFTPTTVATTASTISEVKSELMKAMEELGFEKVRGFAPKNFKSPEKLQAHTRGEAEKSLRSQLEEGSRWFVNSSLTFNKLATISYDVPAKLQDGPQCGIVAGWMAVNALVNRTSAKTSPSSISHWDGGGGVESNNSQNESDVCEDDIINDNIHHLPQNSTHSPVDEVDISVEPSLDEMQRTAIDLKFSRRGEMFTAKNLADLINKCFSHYQITAEVVDNASALLKSLSALTQLFTDPTHHQLILAVYDCGPDQRPCNLKGHKAHWGVITGLATFLPPYHVISNVSSDDGHVENTEKGCFVTRGLLTPPFDEKSDQLKKLFDKSDGNYEVIVRQSKSKRLFFFDPEDLADSCCNLTEVAPDIGSQLLSSQKYVLPPGGIKHGLANKCIIVKRPISS